MKDLDVKSLRLLVAVCEHQNIKRAAEQEHIERSAISKRIALLEEQLGTPLLTRGRRGVAPTPAGEALLEHARALLFTLERIEQDVAALAGGVKGQVRLAASASAIAETLLDDVAAFLREPAHRDIKVDIEEQLSRDIVRALREGSASVGVCWDSADLTGLQHRPYHTDQLALAVHPEHPLAAEPTLRFEQTMAYEHVGLPPSSAVHTMLRQAAARSGVTLAYRAVVSTFDAALRVVAAGLGISVIPTQVGARYGGMLGIRVVPLSDAWALRRFVVCYRDFERLQPAAQRMVEYLHARALTGDASPPGTAS
jgi:DNA-binding transcriptional LysR family regulator